MAATPYAILCERRYVAIVMVVIVVVAVLLLLLLLYNTLRDPVINLLETHVE